jgi:hypothetical protein
MEHAMAKTRFSPVNGYNPTIPRKYVRPDNPQPYIWNGKEIALHVLEKILLRLFQGYSHLVVTGNEVQLRSSYGTAIVFSLTKRDDGFIEISDDYRIIAT